LTSQSVQALADHESKLAAVYADSRDHWAYLDLNDAWPAQKGQQAANLNELAAWVRDKVASRLEA
jgi:CRISPR system Cascade subunit CasC